MPSTFQYQPYRSDATGTIADLISRRGQIAAQGAQASGQARAAAIGNIGQSVAGSLDQYLTEKKNAPIRALQTKQLEQSVIEGQQKIDAGKRAAMATDVLAAGVQKFGDDAEKVVAFVTKNGFPDVADGYLKTHDLLRGIKEGAIKDQDTANAFEADVLTRISKLATPDEKQAAWTAAQGVLKAHRVDTSSLSPAWNDEQAQQQIALYGPKPKLMSVAPGSTVIDQNNPDGAPLVTAPNPAQQETARHNAEMEKIATMTAGRADAAQQETARHNRALEAAATAKATQAAGDVTSLTPEGLDAAAMMFAKTGQLPALGMGDKTTRKQIINRAAVLMPGLDIASAKADFTANQGSLKNVTQTLDTLSAFENTAGKNLDQFLSLAAKVPDTGVPWLNTPVRMLNASLVGSDNQAAFNAARDVALREIARVTNDPKLSGVLSDSARHEVSGLSPQNATFAQIKHVAEVLKQDMANVHSSLNEQRGAIQSRIAKAGSATGVDVKDPTGATHHFDTQAQADAFKKLAKIP